MKTAISIPDSLFREATAAARHLGVSRSRLVQEALEEFLERRRDAQVTASINEAIAKYGDPSDGEEDWLEHGRQVIANMKRDEW
jgi:metal-responsive CopG/Arc/MetJ family transcriptional regulator